MGVKEVIGRKLREQGGGWQRVPPATPLSRPLLQPTPVKRWPTFHTLRVPARTAQLKPLGSQSYSRSEQCTPWFSPDVCHLPSVGIQPRYHRPRKPSQDLQVGQSALTDLCFCVHSFLYSFMKVKVKSCLTLATPWTVAHRAPLSKGFPRQEYWSGLPFPSPGDLPDPEIEPQSPALQTEALPSESAGRPLIHIL